MNRKQTILRWLRAGMGMWVLGASIVWLSGGCGEKIPPEDVEPAVMETKGATRAVERILEPVFEQASGSLVSARQTTISSKILARIESVRVRAGSIVQKGDLLVLLDARALGARVREAQHDLDSARARLGLAEKEDTRAEELFRAGAATHQQIDRARAQKAVAHAAVAAAQQRLADILVRRSYARIDAPVSGRVIDRLAEPGDTAAPGVPLLRIYDPGALRLEVPVRESLAVRLSIGQPLSTRIEALARDFAGTIEEIVPFAEPGARTLLIKVRLPNDPALVAGLFGRVKIPAQSRRELVIPESAVTRVGQLEFATVIDEVHRAERRLITTGRRKQDERVEVLSGLSEGEQIRVSAPIEATQVD